MRAIEQIIAYWKKTKGGRSHAVGFGGLDIHWGPWTLGDQDQIFGPFTDERGRVIMRPAVFARMLVVKAEDGTGNMRLFDASEEVELLAEADPKEIVRIGMLMMDDLNRTNEAAADANGPKATT
jgi:hypothetical protein